MGTFQASKRAWGRTCFQPPSCERLCFLPRQHQAFVYCCSPDVSSLGPRGLAVTALCTIRTISPGYPAMDKCQISDVLNELSSSISDFEGLVSVPSLQVVPDAHEFAARFAARNLPCVLRGAASHWGAVRKWSIEYITSVMGSTPVTCTFTPDGRADSVKVPCGSSSQPVFVLPHTEMWTMKQFLDVFRQTRKDSIACVPSVQFQNSNLSEFEGLKADIDFDVGWAALAFQTGAPDAVNIWIGDSRCSTSFHKVRVSEDPEAVIVR